MFDVKNLSSIKISLASPDKVRQWSKGEVTKPETINYRSLKPEMEGLMCEKIFGPSKDYECHCGKYKKIKYQGVVCEKCGVEVISREVRRERMGHIELAAPCTHIWYLKGIPSRIGLVLDMTPKHLEEITYFISHVCVNKGTSTIEYKQFIDDNNGREIFLKAIKDIQDKIEDKDSADYAEAQEYIDELSDPDSLYDYFKYAEFVNLKTGAEFKEGAEAIKRLLHEVNLKEEFDKTLELTKKDKGQKLTNDIKRLEVLDAFIKSGNKPEWMILDVIPVIPPDIRPMLPIDGGRYANSDLNDLYRRVITRNNRLKKFINGQGTDVMVNNEKRMLQEAVDALIDNGRRNGKPTTGSNGRALKSLSATLKGKQGRFRQNLLGKRVDYSGRSVIAIGPSLKMYQCGLPREMAINLLRPFIAAILIKEGKCTLNKQADKKIDNRDEDVLDIVEKIISQHPVLLNRAPTLHRLGIQAFQPVLVDGRAIRLHPLVCTGFNADFDGDQMAVHVPISKAAQEEALRLMLASNNILKPTDGEPVVTPSQDILIGNYYLTTEETKNDFLATSKKYHELALKDKENSEDNKVFEEDYLEFAKMEGKVFKDINEIYKAYDLKKIHLHTRIALPAREIKKTCFNEKQMNSYLITTIGKVIFNLVFPEDFPYINDGANKNIDNMDKYFVPKGTNIVEYISKQEKFKPVKKGDIKRIINEVYHRYGIGKTAAILDKLKDNGFKYSTISGLTIAISDISVSGSKYDVIKESEKQVKDIEESFEEGSLTDKERYNEVVKIWQSCTNTIADNVAKDLTRDTLNPLFIMSDSGARGSKSNFTQLMGMRGLMGSTTGETIEIPIKSCFREGLNVAEFFTGTHGARKGGTDTALKTAESGYLTRRLVDVSQDVVVREENCHTDDGSYVESVIDEKQKNVIVSLYDRLVGRFTCGDVINPATGEVIVKNDTEITEELAKQIVDAGIEKVKIRSLFGCRTKDGVCVHCYGRNLATGKLVEVGQAVGIMAAQSIGEPGTQLTMRTFHSGGVAGGDITQGLPRVQELLEARTPKGKALISEINGKVTKIEDNAGIYTVTVVDERTNTIKEYDTDFGAKLCVKVGSEILAGGRITEGPISPKELLAYSGKTDVQEYIIREVQKVYRSQGINLSDKHIEVIIRQMLSKCIISKSGETDLIAGSRVSISKFLEANQKALSEGKEPADMVQLILGITKAALETESFLSAASFQETTRVLTDAAIKGKTDVLHGLKENVITGKLIPAGNGLLDTSEEREILSEFDVLNYMKGVKQQYIGVHDKEYSLDTDEGEFRYLESLSTDELTQKEPKEPLKEN